jgi:hypothetical protein
MSAGDCNFWLASRGSYFGEIGRCHLYYQDEVRHHKISREYPGTIAMSSEFLERPPVRLTYLPFDQVEVGMVLGEPVTLTDRNILRFSLPAGHQLTEGNLRNLATHRAEFLCIARPDMRSEDERISETAATVARVTHIFEGADLSQPVMAALFNRVLSYRSQ